MNPVECQSSLAFAGVTFRGLTCEQLVIPSSGLKLVFPVNAELILMAQDNPEFREILSRNSSTFDGFWPHLVARLRSRKQVQKISGSEYVHSVFECAARQNLKVFFLGAMPSVNQAAREEISSRYGIAIDGYSPDFESYPYTVETNAVILQKIRCPN